MVVDGSFSEATSTITAIVAGSVFSCAILHMILIWPCDRLLHLWLRLSLAKYVDNVSVGIIDLRTEVVNLVPAVVDAFIKLMDELDWKCPGELRAMSAARRSLCYRTPDCASSSSLRCDSMALMLPRPPSSARNLSVDFQSAGRRARPVRAKRLGDLNRRGRKFLRMKRAGARAGKVASTGLKPTVTYGIRYLGLPPYSVRQLRRIISASLPGQHLGRSTTLRLAMHEWDPQHEIAAAPLTAWAAAIWDSTVTTNTLYAAWQRQQVAVGLAPLWRKVVGPAGACIMSMQRLGWARPRWDSFITRGGHRLMLDEVCPADVETMARLDSEAAMWAA